MGVEDHYREVKYYEENAYHHRHYDQKDLHSILHYN